MRRALARKAGVKTPSRASGTPLPTPTAPVEASWFAAVRIPRPDVGGRLFDHWHQSMHKTVSALSALAQSTGALRSDLDVSD